MVHYEFNHSLWIEQVCFDVKYIHIFCAESLDELVALLGHSGLTCTRMKPPQKGDKPKSVGGNHVVNLVSLPQATEKAQHEEHFVSKAKGISIDFFFAADMHTLSIRI